MIRYLTIDEVFDLHRYAIQGTGGADHLLNRGFLESAIALPQAAYGGEDLYPDVFAKAAALAYSLIHNHAFADGNKRVAYWSMKTFLLLNRFSLTSDQDEGADFFFAVAAGERSRDQLVEWITMHSHMIE